MFCVYLHVPFCKKICDYCDFRVMPSQSKIFAEYTDLLCKQIVSFEGRYPGLLSTAKTLYLGGGTPSELPAEFLRRIFECLASVGLAAGGRFVSTILSANGAMWVLYGFLITIIPLLIAVIVARGKFHLNYCTIMGLVAGATTDPPALGYANTTAGNDAPAVAYATVYPLTMFMRVLIAELIIIFAVA